MKRAVLFLLAVALYYSAACQVVHFRKQIVHPRSISGRSAQVPPICHSLGTGQAGSQTAQIETYAWVEQLHGVIDQCIRIDHPKILDHTALSEFTREFSPHAYVSSSDGRLDEQQVWCDLYWVAQWVSERNAGMGEMESMTHATQALRTIYDSGYREPIEKRTRAVRVIIDDLHKQAPQDSLLYALEAYLYLSTGYALDQWSFLLDKYDRDAAEEWYRRAIERSRKAQELSRGWGAAHVYEADALARLGRCPEAQEKLQKLQTSGYMTSSTHALAAYCRIAAQGEDAASAELDAAVDSADSEVAASWASEYKRYLGRRATWEQRIAAMRAKDELGEILDDTQPSSLPRDARRLEIIEARCEGKDFRQEILERPRLPISEFVLTRRPFQPRSLKFRLGVLNLIDQTGSGGVLVNTIADVLTTGLYETRRFDLLDRGQLRSRGASQGDVEKTIAELGPDGLLQGAITQIRTDDKIIVLDIRVTNRFTNAVIYANSAELRYTGAIDIQLDRRDVSTLSRQIADAFPKADEREPIKIAKIDGEIVTLTGGIDRDVKVGMSALVQAQMDLTRDPDTGDVLQSHTFIGQLSVFSVEDRVSKARIHPDPTTTLMPEVRVGDAVLFK